MYLYYIIHCTPMLNKIHTYIHRLVGFSRMAGDNRFKCCKTMCIQ